MIQPFWKFCELEILLSLFCIGAKPLCLSASQQCLRTPGPDAVGLSAEAPLGVLMLKCRASVAVLVPSHVCAPSWDLPCYLGVIPPLTRLQVEHGFSHPLYRAWWKEGLPMGLPGGAGLQPNGMAEKCWSVWHVDRHLSSDSK